MRLEHGEIAYVCVAPHYEDDEETVDGENVEGEETEVVETETVETTDGEN